MNSKNQSTKLVDIFEKFKNQQIVLPNFQRNYVWTKKEAASLLQSMIKGFFIGNIMLCELDVNITAQNLDLKIQTKNNQNNNFTYIIDGQQRITTLYCMYYGGWRDHKKHIDLSKIYININDDGGKAEKIDISVTTNEEDKRQWFSAADLFEIFLSPNSNDIAIENWFDEKKFNYRIKNKIRAIADQLDMKNYLINVISLHGYTLDDALEQFSKSNTQGKKLTKYDIFSANYCGNNNTQNSNKNTKKLDEKISSLINLISMDKKNQDVNVKEDIKKILINTFCLCKSFYEDCGYSKNDLNGIKLSSNWIFSMQPKDNKLIDDIIKTIKEVIDFVNKIDLNITKISEFPYTHCLTAICFLFVNNNNFNYNIQSSSFINIIKKYILTTGFYRMYDKSASSQLEKDIKNLIAINKIDTANRVISDESILLSNFKSNTAFNKSYLLFLSLNKMYSWSRKEIKKSNILSSKTTADHIFPKSKATTYVWESVTNHEMIKKTIHSYSNIALTTFKDNSVQKNDKLPKYYFEEIIKQIIESEDYSEQQYIEEILGSQFISEECFNFIKKGNYQDFITERAKTIFFEIKKAIN